MVWDVAISRYISEKEAGHCPAHLRGRRLRSFRPGTSDRTRSILRRFQTACGQPSPQQVTAKDLQAHYDNLRKKSEASARSSVIRVQAFLEHLNCLPGRALLARDKKPEVRKIVIGVEEIAEWIRDCPRDDLKFALYCGFHAGLRRDEIVHARPAWFSSDLAILTVPDHEMQTLADGRQIVWESKDRETREIPLTDEFVEFLRSFLKRDARFCLHPEACSKRYRWDFRRPFENYVASKGRRDCTIHAMRHSWITAMCNSGNHTTTEVATYSGDGITVVEKHYWKKNVRRGALNDTMGGKRSGDALKEVAATLKTISVAGLDRATIEAIQKLVAVGERQKAPSWEWTEKAPSTQRRLYSVEDTVNSFGVLRDLLDPGVDDPDMPAVTQFDWDEGRFSTIRSRLKTLEDIGLIRPVTTS